MSRHIQSQLDANASLIQAHLSKLRETLFAFDQDMRSKLDRFISRDVRPPVLVIPCPPKRHSREIYATAKSNNALVEDDESECDLVPITRINSEDSLLNEET